MTWPAPITALSLFVDDLAGARAFYEEVFGLTTVFADDVSAVFDVDGTLVNLLHTDAAVELVEPAPVGPAGTASRVQLTVTVDDVDAVAALVTARGATLVNGPVDRAWGVRTACFADPAGHLWEVAAPLPAG